MNLANLPDATIFTDERDCVPSSTGHRWYVHSSAARRIGPHVYGVPYPIESIRWDGLDLLLLHHRTDPAGAFPYLRQDTAIAVQLPPGAAPVNTRDSYVLLNGGYVWYVPRLYEVHTILRAAQVSYAMVTEVDDDVLIRTLSVVINRFGREHIASYTVVRLPPELRGHTLMSLQETDLLERQTAYPLEGPAHIAALVLDGAVNTRLLQVNGEPTLLHAQTQLVTVQRSQEVDDDPEEGKSTTLLETEVETPLLTVAQASGIQCLDGPDALQWILAHKEELVANIRIATTYTGPTEREKTILADAIGVTLDPAQADRAAAMMRTLETHRAVFLQGEMGVGKTRVASAVTRLTSAGEVFSRVLVIAPANTVMTWEQEMRLLNRDAKILHIRTAADVRAFATLQEGVVVGILPSSRMRYMAMETVTSCACPQCGRESMVRGHCGQCGEPASGMQRVGQPSFAQWLSGQLRPIIQRDTVLIAELFAMSMDILIIDEAHHARLNNLLSKLTHRLSKHARKTLLLSGTHTDGRASETARYIARFSPEVWQRLGYGPYPRLDPIVTRFGLRAHITVSREEEEDGKSVMKTDHKRREIPGFRVALVQAILPVLVPLYLSDLSTALPPLEQRLVPVKVMDDGMRMWKGLGMDSGMSEFKYTQQYQECEKLMESLPPYLQGPALLHWATFPDGPAITVDDDGRAVTLPEMVRWQYPMERAVREIVAAAREDGQRVLVVCSQIHQRPYKKRLVEALAEFDAVEIPASKPEKREAMIRSMGAKVMVCGIREISEGLNLQDVADHMVFAEPVWSAIMMMQTLRRLYRLGRTEPVTVSIPYVPGTITELVVRNLAEKAVATQFFQGSAIEGSLVDFSAHSEAALTLMSQRITIGDVADTLASWKPVAPMIVVASAVAAPPLVAAGQWNLFGEMIPLAELPRVRRRR